MTRTVLALILLVGSAPLLADELVFEMPEETAREWPFAEWSYAKAYTFNFVGYGPGQSLYIFRDGTWNESIRSTHKLSREQAQEAFDLTDRLRGEMWVSKCPFPRHAVVFFNDNDEPVGSVNVCFSCGDILVWPPYYSDDEEPDEELKDSVKVPPEKREAYQAALDVMTKDVKGDPWLPSAEDSPAIQLVYFEVMPAWERFFRDDLGVPLEPPKKRRPRKKKTPSLAPF